jgi:GDP-L-fucose synthase
MAQACVFLMNLPEDTFQKLLASNRNDGLPPLLNLGSGTDSTIAELADLVKKVVGFNGDIVFDITKPDGTMRKLMDSSRLNQLGWKLNTTLTNGLELAYQDFKNSQEFK